ncbi:MAG TPA: YeeE/YedE family protein [Burkholderiales bacterium]|nr:YeeE/YedE family protein [Burkholderiales bacterium]
MTIDWAHFTPWMSLAGGLMIGIAAAGLAAFNGRVAGISGILGGLLRSTELDRYWRIAFVLGLIAAPLAYALFAVMPQPVVDAGYPAIMAAGVLVGFGSRLGGGCTSGHGVCGISRLSLRGFAATLSFMAAGFSTVYVVHHVLG